MYNFTRVFKARGIDKPFTYLRKAGFSDSFATKINKNNIVRLDPKFIEKLCILLKCTPNDLFEWYPDEESNLDADHPLNKIKHSDKVVDITATLNSVPLEQLDEIEQLIKDKIQSI